MEMELRFNPVNIEANEDGSMVVSGYVNETGQFSRMLGRQQRFVEKIEPGAFKRALERATEIHFLAEHDNQKILSSTRNGSLKLVEDDKGLYMSAEIAPTSWGKDYYALIKSGILHNLSFGFRAVKDSWKKVGNYFERSVSDLDLFEISVVRDPAYTQSSVSARGIDVVEDIIPEDVIRSADNEIEISFEIRNSEDLDKLAEKLFEMISEKMRANEVPGGSDDVNEDDDEIEDSSESDDVKDEINNKDSNDNKESDEDESGEDDSNEDGKDENSEDEQPNGGSDDTETVVDTAAEDSAKKLREFINQFKTEDK